MTRAKIKPNAKTSPASPRKVSDAKGAGQRSPSVEHEGATEAETGDRTGPGAGYDTEPEQVKDKGGVAGG